MDHRRSHRIYAPGPGELPAIDDHIAPPETRVEYLDGAELFASPALQPHATKHSGLNYVLQAHARKGYLTAVDMLTRTGEASDFAPDASIFPAEPDPRTGGRKIEEIAFEVSDKQSLSVPTKKARELAARGVRRVFCILIRPKRLLEWSRKTDGWETLPDDGVIEDPVLVRPFPMRALLDAAAADDAVARALLAKRIPAIEEALAEREAQGEALGEIAAKRAAILAVLGERSIAVSARLAARIASCEDASLLDCFIRQSATASSAGEALRKPRRRNRR